MTYWLIVYRERFKKSYCVENTPLYMCIHTYIPKEQILLGLGPLAYSSVIDHHPWAPLKGSKSMFPGNKKLTLKLMPYKTCVRCITSAVESAGENVDPAPFS